MMSSINTAIYDQGRSIILVDKLIDILSGRVKDSVNNDSLITDGRYTKRYYGPEIAKLKARRNRMTNHKQWLIDNQSKLEKKLK